MFIKLSSFYIIKWEHRLILAVILTHLSINIIEKFTIILFLNRIRSGEGQSHLISTNIFKTFSLAF